MKEIVKHWWMGLIKGIILLLLSVFVFRHPVGALLGLAVYIGIGLMATGFLLIGTALFARKTEENWGWKLVEGIIDVLFAIVLLSNPAVTAAVFPFIVGFWMMVYGATTFGGSFRAKKDGDSNWWLYLLSGILTILFGYFITANLLAGAITITIWIGLGFLLFGLVNISLSLRLRKVNAAIK